MKKGMAVVAVMRKMLIVAVHLIQTEESYDPGKVAVQAAEPLDDVQRPGETLCAEEASQSFHCTCVGNSLDEGDLTNSMASTQVSSPLDSSTPQASRSPEQLPHYLSLRPGLPP